MTLPTSLLEWAQVASLVVAVIVGIKGIGWGLNSLIVKRDAPNK